VTESVIYTIDDDADFNMVLKLALKPYNIHVVTHTNADDFVKSVKTKLPDLCILDLNLEQSSGGEGFQLLGAMRNVLGNQLPIFIMSKRGEKDDVLKAMEMGANDFVPKPLDDKYLLSKLKSFLPNNGDLKDLDVHFSKVSERDRNAEIKTGFKLLRLSLEEIEVESDIFLTKEMNLYFIGDILEEVFNNPRMNFKVIDSWITDEGPCRAKLEKELSHEEFFSLRRWLIQKKIEGFSELSAASLDSSEESN
jgi:two-component system response regulator ResD